MPCGLGTRVETAPTSIDALVLAGLDWTVEQKNVYAEDGSLIPGYEVPDVGTCVFEAKTASAYKAGEWEDTIPDEYMCQVQHYMAVTGYKGTYHRKELNEYGGFASYDTAGAGICGAETRSGGLVPSPQTSPNERLLRHRNLWLSLRCAAVFP